ncbi:MAG TPA: TIGR01777 family oxidoreductase [Gemmatimonadales bacterium]
MTDRGPRRIAVTGATGFIGSALVARLAAGGHTVHRISRSAPAPGSGDVRWDPARGELDPRALEGVDAVVHLAGENIGQRWTAAARRRIVDSRVQGTTLLARTLATLERKPRVLVSVSAVGIYGDTGDRVVDESSPPGTGFLADVVRAWERSADAAREAGIRVVHPRLGVVLGAGGGALARMLLPFHLGVGGRIGSGRQWMSWIAHSDAVRALETLATRDGPAGPVNVAAPPVTNADFTRALGRALHRPTIIPIPALALRAIYGRMAVETLIAGQRAASRRMGEMGVELDWTGVEEALREELRV